MANKREFDWTEVSAHFEEVLTGENKVGNKNKDYMFIGQVVECNP